MTRNAENDKKMRQIRREKIVQHALGLFASKGLFATKVSDIAAEAGMSQGLLYHYFSSKEEIFTELVGGAFEKMNAAARALEGLPLDPKEKIKLALVQLLQSIEQSEDFANTVLLIAQASISDATPPAARTIMREQSNVPYVVIERIIREGQQNGSIKKHDARELSLVFWTTIKGLALHKAVYPTAFKAPDVRVLTSLFFCEDRGEHRE